jgi:hypothetical protein
MVGANGRCYVPGEALVHRIAHGFQQRLLEFWILGNKPKNHIAPQ